MMMMMMMTMMMSRQFCFTLVGDRVSRRQGRWASLVTEQQQLFQHLGLGRLCWEPGT